jgi:ketosteroid isomerase-like protein
MSQANVELVRGLQPSPDTDLVALFLDDATFDALAPFFHEDCEILGPSVVTGGESERRIGLQGLRALWLDWLDPWESYRVEIEDVIDAGEQVVVLPRDYGRRAGMDVEVGVLGGAVWTVRDGKIARVAFYLRRSEAFEAVGAVYHGHEGVREFLSLMQEQWATMRIEPQDFIDSADDVVVPVRLIARGRHSGVETTANAAHVWTFRDRKVIRYKIFQTLHEALEAVGIRE